MVSRVLALLLFSMTVNAAELEGVTLENRVQVAGQDLVLNGIALRTRYVFVKVYVAALYLTGKTTSASAAIEARGSKRIVLVMLHDATAEQFLESIDAGLRLNLHRIGRRRREIDLSPGLRPEHAQRQNFRSYQQEGRPHHGLGASGKVLDLLSGARADEAAAAEKAKAAAANKTAAAPAPSGTKKQ